LSERSRTRAARSGGPLKRYSFQDIDATADERSFGWVSFETARRPFRLGPVQKAHYLLFTLRLDTRRISRGCLRSICAWHGCRAPAAGKEGGRAFVTKDRKTEIAEQVKLRLLPKPCRFGRVRRGVECGYARGPAQFHNAKVRNLFETSSP
jgi:hypothetical protein